MQLVGLYCENHFNSPTVLLTDFVNEFSVLSLRRLSKNPLKYEINTRRFPDISFALSSVHQISMLEGITEDLGRSNTPHGSDEGGADISRSSERSSEDDANQYFFWFFAVS